MKASRDPSCACRLTRRPVSGRAGFRDARHAQAGRTLDGRPVKALPQSLDMRSRIASSGGIFLCEESPDLIDQIGRRFVED